MNYGYKIFYKGNALHSGGGYANLGPCKKEALIKIDQYVETWAIDVAADITLDSVVIGVCNRHGYFPRAQPLTTKEPIMINKNIQELAQLRERVAELERMEAGAHAVLLRELQGAMPWFNWDMSDARNVAAAAEAIRDALAPFDSGTRAAPPPVVAPSVVARAYGDTSMHRTSGPAAGME